jgi:hypothetical protein
MSCRPGASRALSPSRHPPSVNSGGNNGVKAACNPRYVGVARVSLPRRRLARYGRSLRVVGVPPLLVGRTTGGEIDISTACRRQLMRGP